MSLILAVLASFVGEASACAMEPMEYRAVAQAEAPVPKPLVDAFAEIDAAAQNAQVQATAEAVQRAANQIRAAQDTVIPEVQAVVPAAAPPAALPSS
jgi:predicted outer membrane protein